MHIIHHNGLRLQVPWFLCTSFGVLVLFTLYSMKGYTIFQLRIHGLVLEPVLTPGADNAPVVELIEEHVVVPHITSELNDLF